MSLAIPDGWTEATTRDGYTVIVEPGLCTATIDWFGRVVRGGHGCYGGSDIAGRHPVPGAFAPRYTGRGWRDRLVADAVEWIADAAK